MTTRSLAGNPSGFEFAGLKESTPLLRLRDRRTDHVVLQVGVDQEIKFFGVTVMGRWQYLFLWMCLPVCTSAAERFVAMFADGNRVEEAEVREWNELNAQPKIGGRPLFDPNVPVRWIIDRQQSSVVQPAMFVEFEGGDRLAGEVIAHFEGRENPYETKPAYLVVRPVAEMQPPDVTQPAQLRIAIEWVRKVVFERVATEEYRPGTVWLKTGTSLAFRSLRWTLQGITVLTADGVKEYSLSDLGEIHLPRLNPWSAYYEQLAALSPHLKSRLLQLNTSDGSRWTTSLERFQSRHHGDKNRPEQWYQLIQPAWSLDSVWLRYRTIRRWRFFFPHEIPLSNVIPVEAKHEAVFGREWEYQQDQNVRQGPLQSADHEFGWGFGVQGTSELVFEYPDTARALRTRFGLDRSAEKGGCVDVEVVVGNGQSLLKQTNVIGSAFVGEVAWQNLPSVQAEHRRISLRTGMAHQGRPAGADPFDVRDVVNWYEPELRLDPAALEAEVAVRRAGRLRGLIGWTLSPADSASIRLANVVDNTDVRDPQFRLTAHTSDSFYILSRKVKIGLRDRWLALIASRFAEDTSPTAVQIRIEGRVYAEFDVPIRHTIVDPEPMLVPVDVFQGRSVTVEVVVYPADTKSWVDWRGLSISPDRPGLLTLFEDDESFAAAMNLGAGKVMIDSEKPFSGKKSVKVVPPSASNPEIAGLDALICEAPQLGHYRYALFAWKKQTGSRIQIQFANRGRFIDGGFAAGRDGQQGLVGRGLRRTLTVDERGQKYGYCYEQGAASAQFPLPLWLNGDLPREWQLVRRDMFADFGLLFLTGLSLNCVDGDAALFDHLYLARTNLDVDYAATYLVNPVPSIRQPDANGNLTIERREDYPREFSRIAPLFSSLDMPHGIIRQAEQSGQTDVLRTHANEADKPLILHAAAALPKDRPMMLDLHLTHHPQYDWQLVVRANGQVIHDQLIDEKLTTPQRGWATIQVDLSKFAGQKVLLEVLNQSNNWQTETAYWKRIELVEQ